MNKIIKQQKQSKLPTENAGRVFIFPTLQLNVVNYREDENTFLDLLKFFSKTENNLE